MPGGNLGNVTAVGLGFQLMQELGIIQRLPRIVCAQSANANPLYRSYLKGFAEFEPAPAKPTLATAIQIGNPVSAPRAIKVLEALGGVVEQATENELSHAAALADSTGLFSCPQTGVALAALLKLVARGEIERDDRVVVLSTASGLKFIDFKIGYHGRTLPGVESLLANSPVELPGSVDAVIEAIASVT